MDDLKREIYMEALRLLDDPLDFAFCTCLKIATKQVTGYQLEAADVPKFFPEFIALADGCSWTQRGAFVPHPLSSRNPTDYYWWEPYWQAPRRRLLQTLLGR